MSTPTNRDLRTAYRQASSPYIDSNYLHSERTTPLPIISGVTGTFTDGNSITISGSGFGTKTTAKPLIWADFSVDTSPTTDGTQTAWDYTSVSASRVSTTIGGRTGTFLRDDISAHDGGMGFALYNLNITNFFCSFKRYYAYNIVTDKGPSGFNNKANRFWYTLAGSENNIYHGWQGNEGTDSWRAYNEYTELYGAHGTQIGNSTGKTAWQNSVWQNERILLKMSGVGVSGTPAEDGVFAWYRDGVNAAIGTKLDATGQVYPSNGTDERLWQFRTDTHPNTYQLFFMDQCSNGTGTGPLYLYYTDFYADTTWAHTFISSQSTFASAMADAEMLLPTAWSATSITAKFRHGTINLSNPVFLYVMASDRTYNTNGYQII